jgi:hypothetical protein
MASAGVLHPRVFFGRLFINAATSLSQVWRASVRLVPLGMNWRKRPFVFSLLPSCQGACGSQDQISIFSRRASSGWQAISEIRSYVILLRSAAGRRFIRRVKLFSTASAPLPFILHRTTKRVLRSTSVPTAERLKAPLIRSPSQCPRTRRASISSGRWMIRNVYGTMALPANVVRLSPRVGLACRRALIIVAFSPPRGWA